VNQTRRVLQIAVLFLVIALLAGLIGPAPVQAQTPTPEPDATVEAAAPDQADVPGAVTSTITIKANQDSFISSGFPNANFGGTVNLDLGWQSGSQNAMRILMQFNLSGIPRNAVINSAVYQIYQQQVFPVGDGPMDFRAQFLTQSWNENSVTWNNASYLGGQSLPLGAVPGNIGWQQGNAIDVVQAWLSGGQSNYGLMITGDERSSLGRYRVFASRETGSGPQLVINYTANCDTVPPVANVLALPQFEPDEFIVSWTGQDFAPSGCQPSGIANYDVEYNINGRGWTNWKQRTTATSNTFKGYASNGAFVQFRARATDRAGNVGQYTDTQASTTVDAQPPVANMVPLQEFQTFAAFAVNWFGTDNLSGIASYDVEFQLDGGGWQMLVEGTPLTTYQITGAQTGNSYGFRVRATDRVGNVETWPIDPQTETVVLTYPLVALSPIVPAIITTQTLPVSDTITLNWEGFTAPGTTLASYKIYYTYGSQPRTEWQTVPAEVVTAVFPYVALGLGDGIYTFDVIAYNNLGQFTDINSQFAEFGREKVIVDLAGNIKPQAYMPVVFQEGAPQ